MGVDDVTRTGVPGRARATRTAWSGAAVAMTLLVAALLVDVQVIVPRVDVRWVDEAQRPALEARYGLVDARHLPEGTWRYQVIEPSRARLTALQRDPQVASFTNIQSSVGAPDGVRVHLGTRRPDVELRSQSALLGVLSLVLILASTRRRAIRIAAVGVCLAALLAGAVALPIADVRMGDANTYTASREAFDAYTGAERLRFEAHLSSLVIRGIDHALGSPADGPTRAFDVLSRLAGVWFCALAVLVCVIYRWSPDAIRYVGLAAAMPATLMYFGYREFGYLSLNVAVFPLLVDGVRRLRATYQGSAALAGLGAALHGFGILALAGVATSTLVARHPWPRRLALLLQAFAFGTALYLVWLFADLAILHRSIDPGHSGGGVPWRPVWHSVLSEYRIVSALTTRQGAAEVLTAWWTAGVPLVVMLWGADRDDRRLAIAYLVPSLLALTLIWPVQGLAVESDLVFGAFPAVFALLWVAARSRAAAIAAWAMLLSSQAVFWRVVVSDWFVNRRVL